MASSQARLLLVDDDPAAIHAMSRMLAAYPFQRFATSGTDALRLAREEIPDLVLLDADMPGLSGFDVCDAMKADPQLARVPIIFATGHGTVAHEVTALRKGAADFVTKPIAPDQLVSRVSAHLRSHAAGLGAQPAEVRAAVQPGATVLVVDDDPVAVHALRAALEGCGDLHFALGGAQAIELAQDVRPDLVLLDARMPDMDGFQVCTTLKALPAFRHVPIVFVTRYGEVVNERRALELGAADFIVKPYSVPVLKARVRNLLALKQRIDAELDDVHRQGVQLADAHVAGILRAVAEPLVTCDVQRRIVQANAAACRLVGAAAGGLIGEPVRTLLGESVAWPPAPGGEPQRVLLSCVDGSQVPVEMLASWVGEGERQLVTLVLRDLRDRDRLELETRARTAAEAASRAKTQMLGYFAHEVGNPLNAILGFAQLMAADTAHPLPPTQGTRLQHVLDSGRRLQTMLRDVLDFGRAESGRLAVGRMPVDLASVARDALASVSAQAEDAGIACDGAAAVEHAGEFVALADAARVHQCLVNLLGNAIKYSPRGARCELLIGFDADGMRVFVAVCDEGIGMNDEQLAHLFEPFNRLGRTGRVPGAGLGLVITRQLVEAMGGEIRVQSQAGVGSRFDIVLPRADA